MTITSEGIVKAALSLSGADRAQVVQELLDSLSPDAETALDDVWAAELDRRLADFIRDEAGAVAWSQLKEQK